jgi:hypothetical protein
VDAERGITYGEFTNENLLIKVEEYSIYQEKGADEFGLVNEGCTVKLSGVLKKIELKRRVSENGLIRYRWELFGSPPEAVENSAMCTWIVLMMTQIFWVLIAKSSAYPP